MLRTVFETFVSIGEKQETFIDKYGGYIFLGIFLLLIIILLRMSNLIDRIYDDNGNTLFSIYNNKSGGFKVFDYTRRYNRKVFFKTYVDVEAYIYRRYNGWKVK